MQNNKTPLVLMLSACVALLPLAGCDKKADTAPAASAPQVPQAQAAPAYVPPTAEQLYQLVGPIALFPDKLVAQVLAASSYPDQVTAADNWLAQNRNLKGSQLQDAANQQPWDVSVKGLTQFPSVLDQMARNIPWTSALGDAYVNDPVDVMNAIQVMRQRAASSGNLKNTKQLRIAVRPRAEPAPAYDYAQAPGEPQVYDGPEMIPPPPETIVIEPAEPDVVYVPAYNPGVVYGEPLPVYPGYAYEPAPVYYPPGEIVTAGVITFGLGIAVGAVISHHDWGWNSWDVHWGGRPGGDGGGGNWNGGHWHRPAVVYNDNTYVSRSTTIVNRVTNNVTNNNTVINNNSNNNNNNRFNNNNNNNNRNNFGGPANNPALANGGRPGQPGGGAPNFNAARPNFGAQGNPVQPQMNPQMNQNAAPFAGNPRPNHPQPDFNHMTKPNFGKVPPGANGVGAAPNLNQLARPGFVRPAPNQPQAGEPGHPAFGQPGQNARPMPNQLQQNAQNLHPAPPRNLEAQKPANLNQHPFGGNTQRPNINRPAAPEMARPQPQPQPQPFQPPQNVQNRQPEQFQNRPNGGQQMHQEMNRPPANPAPQALNRPEPRPQPQPQIQVRPQPQPQPQPQMQPRPQPQPQPQMQPRPQPQPQPQMQPRPQPQPQPQMQPRPQPQPQPQVQQPHPQQKNHEQEHNNGGIHLQKKEDDHK